MEGYCKVNRRRIKVQKKCFLSLWFLEKLIFCANPVSCQSGSHWFLKSNLTALETFSFWFLNKYPTTVYQKNKKTNKQKKTPKHKLRCNSARCGESLFYAFLMEVILKLLLTHHSSPSSFYVSEIWFLCHESNHMEGIQVHLM